MSRMPANLLKMRVIYDLPVHLYRQDQPDPETMKSPGARLSFLKFLRQDKAPESILTLTNNKRKMDFNAAIWLEFAESPDKPISLWLMCEDEKGCHAELVDEQRVLGGTSLMLSGNVRVTARGEIKSLRLACAGFADEVRFRLGDHHVKLLSENAAHRRAS